jgi:allantoinase
MTSRYFKSKKVLLNEDVICKPAVIKVEFGKIAGILDYDQHTPEDKSVDFGDCMILPGLVDTHAHINEPGRTEWEGFETATTAAASGGITTVVDMPLNSIPATTSLSALEIKRETAKGKCKIDYGFWGGVVPGNQNELQSMIDAGVIGFKCFLIESGVDEFKMVTREDLKIAMPILAKNNIPLIVHAELDLPLAAGQKIDRTYLSYLQSRPQRWEVEAVKMMIDLCRETKCRTHIVHLSAADALPEIRAAKKEGLPFSVETCPHYLYFDSEHIHDGETFFKCAPPIREKSNQDLLWEALKDGAIDFIVSDHSPCTPALKCLTSGDFDKAWGGIAGLQFSFQAIVTAGRTHGLGVEACNRLMSLNTARFIQLKNKGKIAVGCSADFFIYDENLDVRVTEDSVKHKHKVTPYLGRILKGTILETYLHGVKISEIPTGKEMSRGN